VTIGQTKETAFLLLLIWSFLCFFFAWALRRIEAGTEDELVVFWILLNSLAGDEGETSSITDIGLTALGAVPVDDVFFGAEEGEDTHAAAE